MSKRRDKGEARGDSTQGHDPARSGGASHCPPVIGICSSAGGLSALTRFFAAVPSGTKVAFVVVPHLDPTHESLMAELLAKHTAMPVAQAEDGALVQPDHVYVIPPNKNLSIEHGALRLSKPVASRRAQTAIDAFLRSLAKDQGPRAIAIILSGTGSHGALGIKDVKLAGGMVMAQEPGSAEYDAMPRSAIATGTVDQVLKPEDMPAVLLEYVRHPYLERAGDEADAGDEAQELSRILAVLRARTKYDFRGYRPNMVLRRVQRRMGLCRTRSLADYLRRLRHDPEEASALHKDLLIGVTAFFRNPEAFGVLEQRVIPRLIERRANSDAPVRVWIPACATGEEAYSIGMLMLEACDGVKWPPGVQIFATDLDEESLDIGRAGTYPESITADVTDVRLRRFFVKAGDNSYRVSKQLRETVVFAQQSLIGDAPFSRIDLLSCRNFLIYLEPELQAKVIRLFHFALSTDGYLLLGPSESIGRQQHLFTTVSKKWRVYQRVGPTRHDLVEIPATGATMPRLAAIPAPEAEGRHARTSARRFADVANRVLLADYAPAAVLIDRRYEILHHHGPTVDYLEFPSGRPSTDLLAMSRPGLRTRIRSAVLGAIDTGEVVVDGEARVKREGKYIPCRVTVRPVREAADGDGLFLVSFEDRVEAAALSPGAEPNLRSAVAPADEARVLERLERELQATREDLQNTIEELEGSNEELRASNEEVMSMNEELQSANEELETSKEELQSMNEELNTVNSELQGKVQDLEQANNDITNLLSATDIATLFLDIDMRIKLFTPPTARLLNLIPSDVGRSIGDFAAKIANEDLQGDARRVLEARAPIEKEVWSDPPRRRCYLRRIAPYLTAGQRIEGIVITFVDITERKRSEAELEAMVVERTEEVQTSQRRLAAIVSTAADAIITIDAQGCIELFNPAAERMFGFGAGEVVGQNVRKLMPAPYADEHDGYLHSYRQTGEARIIGIGREVEGRRKDGSVFPIHLTVAETREAGSQRFVGLIRDLTELRQARDQSARELSLNRAIVSTAQAIILRLGADGRILDFNRYMEELSGYTLGEVAGRDWVTTFVPERERGRIHKLFDGAVCGHRTVGNVNPILTKSGAEILVEWHDSLLEIPGEPPSLLAVGQDVTARVRLEREHLQAQKMEAVGRLASGVAHDFNNLIAGVTGGLRIVAKELSPQHASRKLVDQLQDELTRGAAITRRLLNFSRIGNHPKPTLVDPRETILLGEKLLRRLIGEDIEVVASSDDSHSRILVEAGQFEQAVLNLAINSRDAMPEGGRLELGCRDEEFSREDLRRLGADLEPGSYVVVSVADTGCGMDEQTRSQALEAFFTTKAPGLGTGLGLSSVATMMKQCDGQLVLESEVGVGTTVRLLFPRAAASGAAAATGGGGERILVVEDEMLVRLGVQHMLEELGYTARTAADAREALAVLAAKDAGIDLLLTDVVLPGTSGQALVAMARKQQPGIGVLYMSAFAPEDLIAQGRIPPGTPALEKPFSVEALAEGVRGALAAAARSDAAR